MLTFTHAPEPFSDLEMIHFVKTASMAGSPVIVDVPLDDVVGDGGAAVLEGRAPVEGEGLAGEIGAVDVARRFGTVQDGHLEGGRVVARVVGQPQP